MASKPTFSQLVSLACHDLRTPLATASGFAHTLQRLEGLPAPADRYAEMIGAASEQMAELLDLLGVAARVEAGRFEAKSLPIDSRALADEAARPLGDQASVEGTGVEVNVDPPWVQTALGSLGECIRRHGAVERVTYAVDGVEIAIHPVREGVGAIALGEDLKDFGAAVATQVLNAMAVPPSIEGDRLVVRLPQA